MTAPPPTAKLHLPRWRSTGVLAALTIALAIWFLDISGVTESVDGLAYDLCLRAKAYVRSTPARVLLVYVDRQQLDDDPGTCTSLARRLDDLGARSIAFTFPLENPSADLLRMATEKGSLVLARPYSAGSHDPHESASKSKTKTLQLPQDVLTGAVGLAAAGQGIYRKHTGTLRVGRLQQASLEAVVARQVLLDRAAVPGGAYYVDFRGGPDSLPHVTSTAALGGGLVRELVDGKVVLVGLEPEGAFPGISTPMTRGGRKMSLLEFHGHALNTLLTDGPIGAVGSISRLVLFLIAAVGAHFFYQRCQIRWSVGLTLATLLLGAVIALGALCWLSIWLPYVPLIAVQLLCFAVVFERKFEFSDRTVNELVMDQSVMLRRRRWPAGFFSTDDAWDQLVSFAYQMFYLDRLVILERRPGMDHMRVVKAENCAEEDISEQRRDCRRWPFSAAVDAKGPMRLDTAKRSFFKDSRPDQQQYLAPLLFGGELFGYLALEVAGDYLEKFEDFIQRLEEFADEVAVLLYRRRWVQTESDNAQKRRRLLTHIPEQDAFAQLQQANHLLERRLSRLENVFDRASTAAAVFDVFGRMLMTSQRLLQLLQDKGVVPSEMTAVDLLATLTGRDLNHCRRLLRQVILKKQEEMVTFIPDDGTGVFILHIRPLQLESTQSTVVPEAEPFHVHGIHCELIDGMAFLEMHDVKDRVAQHLCHVLSRGLSEVNEVAEKLTQEAVPPADSQRFGEMIRDNVDEAVSTLRDCRQFLAGDIFRQPGDGLPVDAVTALDRAIDATQPSAEDKGVAVQLSRPSTTSEVLANPQLIQDVFEAVLGMLAANAVGNSQITVDVLEGVSDVTFTMENSGFGVPAERLKEILDGDPDAEQDSDGFARLREIRHWIEHWGGRMVVSTELGQGMVVRLTLQRYELRIAAGADCGGAEVLQPECDPAVLQE